MEGGCRDTLPLLASRATCAGLRFPGTSRHTPGKLPLALRKGSQGRWLRPRALSQGRALGCWHSPIAAGMNRPGGSQ